MSRYITIYFINKIIKNEFSKKPLNAFTRLVWRKKSFVFFFLTNISWILHETFWKNYFLRNFRTSVLYDVITISRRSYALNFDIDAVLDWIFFFYRTRSMGKRRTRSRTIAIPKAFDIDRIDIILLLQSHLLRLRSTWKIVYAELFFHNKSCVIGEHVTIHAQVLPILLLCFTI